MPWRARTLAALSLGLPSTVALASPPIAVISRPPLERVEFFGDTCPDEMPELEPGEISVTACDFWCYPIVTYGVTRTDLVADTCTVTVMVTEVQLLLELRAASWLPSDASPELLAHEEAHRAICRRVFDEEALRSQSADLSNPLLGQAASCAEALREAAERQVTSQLCLPFTVTSNARVRRIADRFDDLTRRLAPHLDRRRAVAAAFTAVQAESASAETP